MIPSMWILAAAVAAWQAASPAPQPTPPAEQAGQVAIELVVEDARSRTVTDLAPNEVEIEQPTRGGTRCVMRRTPATWGRFPYA